MHVQKENCILFLTVFFNLFVFFSDVLNYYIYLLLLHNKISIQLINSNLLKSSIDFLVEQCNIFLIKSCLLFAKESMNT